MSERPGRLMAGLAIVAGASMGGGTFMLQRAGRAREIGDLPLNEDFLWRGLGCFGIAAVAAAIFFYLFISTRPK